MDPSTPPAPIGEVVSRCMNYALREGDPEAVEQLIAHVLCRAHQMAKALDEPTEARAILYVAHSFAEELAAENPRFDRRQFIRDATKPPS